MNLEVYFGVPLISAAIGWITNRLAIKMLFAPKEPVNLFFFKIQGVLPKRREALAQKLSAAISKHFISQKDLEQHLLNFDNSKVTDEMLFQLEAVVDEFLRTDLPQLLPMASMFISDEVKLNVKKMILSKAYAIFPQIVEKMKKSAFEKIDLEAIILSKAQSLSFEELEDALKSILDKELRFVEIMGGVLGFFIGMLQLLLVYKTR